MRRRTDTLREMVTRTCQWLVLIGFIAINLAAFIYTMTRAIVLPWPVIALSYGMMAPYQSATPYSFALTAESVLEDGSRRAVDLSPYYPMVAPEAAIRQYVPFIHWRKDAEAPFDLASTYHEIARQVLAREQAAHPEIRAVELYWEQWPISPFGPEVERIPFHLERSLVATAP